MSNTLTYCDCLALIFVIFVVPVTLVTFVMSLATTFTAAGVCVLIAVAMGTAS